MKKFLAVLLASALALGTFAFTGCFGDEPSGGGNNNGGVSTPEIPDEKDKDETPDDKDKEDDKDKDTPEVPDDKEDNSGIGKPEMPDDKDLQTVTDENVYDEFRSYYNKIRENGYGNYRVYTKVTQETAYDGEQSEKDGDQYLGTTDKAMRTTNLTNERCDIYAGTKADGNNAAITNHFNSTIERKVDSDNPYLAYLNQDTHDIRKYTGIQKGEQLFGYLTSDVADEYGDAFESDRQLVYFADKPDFSDIGNYYIPCVYAITNPTLGQWSGLATNVVYGKLELYDNLQRDNLIDDKQRVGRALSVGDYEDELLESAVFNTVNIEITAKKNENKFFASFEYTLEFELGGAEAVGKGELVMLIDLNEAEADALPSDGIDIGTLSISDEAAAICYPDLTSEQLTEAVKEGKIITVNIVGDGDLSNFGVYGVEGSYNVLEVTDGKITLDCAQMKQYIDTLRQQFIDAGYETQINFGISFYYIRDLGPYLNGTIYMDY